VFLDPVRTAYLNQLIIDLHQQTGATFLIVTHDINTAQTVPDNIGLLHHGHLAMFGPREMMLSSTEPVVRQFLNAQRIGPIGMSEGKDEADLAAKARSGAGVTNVVEGTGRFVTFGLDTARALVRRPFQVRELIQQAWFTRDHQSGRWLVSQLQFGG
jgi:ABC-type proline/glycine betaine transport system ATPase subunit